MITVLVTNSNNEVQKIVCGSYLHALDEIIYMEENYPDRTITVQTDDQPVCTGIKQ